MKYNTKSIWGAGLVSVPEKYINEAKEKKEPLVIDCKGALMTIQPEDLDKLNHRHEKFKDKFGGEDYYLYDIFWIGDK